MYVHAICKYIRILHKNISASPSKDAKTFFVKKLCGYIANYTMQLVTTGNTANSYLTPLSIKFVVGQVLRGSEFSSYETELRNRVTQNDVTL